MSRPAECYAQAMLELQYPMDVVEQAQAIWECCPALSEGSDESHHFHSGKGSGCSEGISGGSAESALRTL